MTLAFTETKPFEHLSCLLYAGTGVGKTVAACSAPGPIIVANADGRDSLSFARRQYPGKQILELLVTGRSELQELYMHIREGGDPQPKTVVLDSLGSIYKKGLRDHAKDPRNPTLPERGDTTTWLGRYIESLLELPVHVVLVAHDMPVEVEANAEDGSKTIERVPFSSSANPALSMEIMKPLAIVGYCGRKAPEKEGDEPQFVAQLFPGGGRHGKDRTDVIGPVADLNLSSWVERIHAAYGISKPEPEPAPAAAAKSTGRGKAKPKETSS